MMLQIHYLQYFIINTNSASGKAATSAIILLNHFWSFPMKQENEPVEHLLFYHL